jgi:hypothetical protein
MIGLKVVVVVLSAGIEVVVVVVVICVGVVVVVVIGIVVGELNGDALVGDNDWKKCTYDDGARIVGVVLLLRTRTKKHFI